MSSSNSVIRRYTPPTCTLEIAAKNSPLSRWMGQTVLKHLRFKLSFDDPRVSEDQWITVRGDRNQLQALCDAVSHYVQNFLSQSGRFSNGTSATVAEPTKNFISQTEQNSAGIHLQPKGLISHELHLGTLASESSGSTLQLSAVQLADLASALDEYSADVTALPNLEKPRWTQTTPAWGTIAAGLIVAIGVGVPVALKIFEPSAPQTASSQTPSSNDQRLPVQPLPTTPAPNTIGTLPTSPLPLPAGSPGAASTAPNLNPKTLPAQPSQTPQLKIAQEPTVTAPPQQQIQIEAPPVRDVPVAAIPDQTKKPSTTGNSVARSKTPNAEPAPPATSSDSSIASREAAPSALLAPAPAASPRSAIATTTIPQLAEAKTYFQGKWQPPKGLESAIEYDLSLDANGVLTAITPRGELADRFVDRSGIPVTGTKIVSPLKGGAATIRLVLSPDGKVQTFLLQ